MINDCCGGEAEKDGRGIDGANSSYSLISSGEHYSTALETQKYCQILTRKLSECHSPGDKIGGLFEIICSFRVKTDHCDLYNYPVKCKRSHARNETSTQCCWAFFTHDLQQSTHRILSKRALSRLKSPLLPNPHNLKWMRDQRR